MRKRRSLECYRFYWIHVVDNMNRDAGVFPSGLLKWGRMYPNFWPNSSSPIDESNHSKEIGVTWVTSQLKT
ncbi:hypothetical protein G4B88_003497 [Cannabis sativa]|uniref:Uncharacterized protein n=1 Tax=Cannabis sativa TaxID=3483 RepID=A0A7J6GV82_CANSA|nr:hypothetical protein G4B88_003497 [Cannabis sativa]